jgi:hypothetical protein
VFLTVAPLRTCFARSFRPVTRWPPHNAQRNQNNHNQDAAIVNLPPDIKMRRPLRSKARAGSLADIEEAARLRARDRMQQRQRSIMKRRHSLAAGLSGDAAAVAMAMAAAMAMAVGEVDAAQCGQGEAVQAEAKRLAAQRRAEAAAAASWQARERCVAAREKGLQESSPSRRASFRAKQDQALRRLLTGAQSASAPVAVRQLALAVVAKASGVPLLPPSPVELAKEERALGALRGSPLRTDRGSPAVAASCQQNQMTPVHRVSLSKLQPILDSPVLAAGVVAVAGALAGSDSDSRSPQKGGALPSLQRRPQPSALQRRQAQASLAAAQYAEIEVQVIGGAAVGGAMMGHGCGCGERGEAMMGLGRVDHPARQSPPRRASRLMTASHRHGAARRQPQQHCASASRGGQGGGVPVSNRRQSLSQV